LLKFIPTVVAVTVFTALADADTITAFYFTGSPQSWVMQGQTFTGTPSDGWGFSAYLGNGGNYVQLGVGNSSTGVGWITYLAAPLGYPLIVGDYQNATRYPFEAPTAPGMDFSGNGRGDNELSGYFNVLEISSSNGTVTAFAADFVQYDENLANEWDYGSIRYNSTIPLNTNSPIPEPKSLYLAVGGGIALVALALRARRRGYGLGSV
jgi:hypothetical protein